MRSSWLDHILAILHKQPMYLGNEYFRFWGTISASIPKTHEDAGFSWNLKRL